VETLNKDRITGIAMMAFGLVMTIMTSQIRQTGMIIKGDLGSRFFPYFASVGLILCGMGVTLTSKKGEGDEAFLPEGGMKRLITLLGVLILYILLLYLVGFLPASPVMLYAVVTLLAGETKVSPLRKILFSVLMTAIVWLFFEKALTILLPAGILFG